MHIEVYKKFASKGFVELYYRILSGYKEMESKYFEGGRKGMKKKFTLKFHYNLPG